MIPYLNGSLSLHSSLLRTSLETHLEQCSDCTSELNALKSTDTLLDRCMNSIDSRSRFSGSSVSKRVSAELDVLERVRIQQAQFVKRIAIGVACTAVFIFVTLYFTVGRQLVAGIAKDNPAALASQTAQLGSRNTNQPVPTPTISAMFGLNSKPGSHEPTTAAVLR
jgi:hypothetical protein